MNSALHRHTLHLPSAQAMQSAFRVKPERISEPAGRAPLGVYSWRTPPMDGFALPETDDLIVALHLGGSRQVRAVTGAGLSRTVSMPGLVTVLPPGRRAEFRTAGSISLVTLHVPRSGLDTRALAGSHPFAFRDAYASASMQALLRVARRGHAPSPDYVDKLSDALLCHLAHRNAAIDTDEVPDASGRIGHAELHTLLAFVDTHLGSKLNIDDVAAHAGVSRAVFNRAFRCATGTSFHQYLTQRRIARARQMLKQSDLDLAYIAQELGFANQSHFSAAFKTLQRCTPREFRNGVAR
ncbi:helix-turn-helix transcriptional regulator [Hydrocarboniphaga sp.]|uniref:helix-turn-helix transcriptional regulator n=1 Tax=Hydrocarboniphaga sp. TaxID=2033016 RepID=UPI003D147C37